MPAAGAGASEHANMTRFWFAIQFAILVVDIRAALPETVRQVPSETVRVAGGQRGSGEW